MKREFAADVQLISSSGGVYEVVVEGEKIFSKAQLKRFPDDGEIVQLIKDRKT